MHIHTSRRRSATTTSADARLVRTSVKRGTGFLGICKGLNSLRKALSLFNKRWTVMLCKVLSLRKVLSFNKVMLLVIHRSETAPFLSTKFLASAKFFLSTKYL
jgi:hypothetical protein